MKRQTLLVVVILGAVMAICGLILMGLQWLGRPGTSGQAVPLGAVTLTLPGEGVPGKVTQESGWEIQEFRFRRGGVWRLATQPVDDRSWEAVCTRWFQMPHYVSGPFRYKADQRSWFFKEIPLFARGAYVMDARGKRLRFTACFEQAGQRHWVSLHVTGPTSLEKDRFDGVLLSARLRDGSGPSGALAPALASILKDSQYRFVQPLGFILVIPLVATGLVFAIQGLVRLRAGRAPQQLERTPLHLETGLEVMFLQPLQRKLMEAALAVDAEGLTVYTFGTPFFRITRDQWRNRIREGRAWLGWAYVQFDLAGAPHFYKWAWAYRMKRLSLRIYTRSPESLRGLLG